MCIKIFQQSNSHTNLVNYMCVIEPVMQCKIMYTCAIPTVFSFILQRNAFSNPGRAIVKVMTMTTGELDYDEIFHQQEGEEELAFLPVSFILWIIFLVLIPVLLNNLLVSWYSLLISKVHKSKNV